MLKKFIILMFLTITLFSCSQEEEKTCWAFPPDLMINDQIFRDKEMISIESFKALQDNLSYIGETKENTHVSDCNQSYPKNNFEIYNNTCLQCRVFINKEKTIVYVERENDYYIFEILDLN